MCRHETAFWRPHRPLGIDLQALVFLHPTLGPQSFLVYLHPTRFRAFSDFRDAESPNGVRCCRAYRYCV